MRNTARGIIIDKSSNILLIKCLDNDSPSTKDFKNGFWVTPGGGVEANESFESALRREIFEETGIRDIEIRNCILSRIAYANLNSNEQTTYYERYFLVIVNEVVINNENITEVERNVIKEYRWWSIDELRRTDEIVFPKDFKNIIDVKIFANEYPLDITETENIL